MKSGAIFDLSKRAKFRLTGADRLRYLNGQVSNDVRKATETCAVHACVLNAKGKINADIFLVAEGDSFLLDTEPELRETLPARLERYIIADDVQIEDVTDLFALLHAKTGELTTGQKLASAQRFGFEGTDLWLPLIEREGALREKDVCDEACAERLRIEQGIPRWGRELSEEIIPTEANLEASAIDYSKGCYIGQEVISRIKMSGQTNKRLCGLVSLDNAPLEPGMRLTSDKEPGKDLGWITSATRSEKLNQEIALSFVKRGFNEIGTELSAGPSAVRVRIVRLPFQ